MVPNTNSSTSSPMATENVSPATATSAVIADSIASSFSLAKRRLINRGNLRWRGCCSAEYLFGFRIAAGADLDPVGYAHQPEELLHVTVLHAYASVRGSAANRTRFVGAVDAITFLIEPQPARSNGAVRAGRNHDMRVVISGVGNAVDDLELAAGAGADYSSHCHAIDLYDFAILQQRQLAVGNADQHQAV